LSASDVVVDICETLAGRSLRHNQKAGIMSRKISA
jgi:hypothetical protein